MNALEALSRTLTSKPDEPYSGKDVYGTIPRWKYFEGKAARQLDHLRALGFEIVPIKGT